MKSKLGDAVLCAVSKYYRQWAQAEKHFPGIGKDVPLYSKLVLGPCSPLFEDYMERTK